MSGGFSDPPVFAIYLTDFFIRYITKNIKDRLKTFLFMEFMKSRIGFPDRTILSNTFKRS